MKKRIKTFCMSLRDRIDNKLRGLCDLTSPEIRLAIIIALLFAGTILNFYFMFSTLNNWTRRKENMNIEHINNPEIYKQGKVEQIKPYSYDQEEDNRAQE